MVISTTNQVIYNGDGITTAWTYTFPIIEATDIKLTIIDADGTETDVTSDYYVDTVNSTVYYPGYAPGAEPPLEDQPPVLASGQKLVVYRQIPITQEADLGEKWPFNVIELGLDKLTMILQQIFDWWGRTLSVSQSNVLNGFDPSIDPQAGKVLAVNADGDGFECREAMMEVNGYWDGEGRQIKGVADPTDNQDAATKKYVDDYGNSNFMKLQNGGDAWEGRNIPLRNLAGPQSVTDAATKNYVDTLLNGFVLAGDSRTVPFDNVSQMRAADIEAGQIAFTLGYHDVNDGGAGVYNIRSKLLGDVDDGGSIIILDNDNVAELIFNNTLNVKQFGAVGDGVTDDTDAIQAAIDAAALNNCIVVAEGKFLVDSADITVKKGVTVKGNAVTRTSDFSASSPDTNQTLFILNSDYSFVMKECSAIQDVRILNADLNISSGTISEFYGTAIQSTDNEFGFTLENVLLMGFEKGLVLDNVYYTKVHNLFSDSVVGVDASNGCVFAYFEDCLFDQLNYDGVTLDSSLRDDGKGFVFDDCNSFTLLNCMTHCHNIGYDISDSTKIFMKGCVANWYSSATPIATTIGVQIVNTTHSAIEGMEVCHYGNAVVLDDTDMRITGSILRQFTVNGIKHLGESRSVISSNIFLSKSSDANIVLLDEDNKQVVISNNIAWGANSGIATPDFDRETTFSLGLETYNNVNIQGTADPFRNVAGDVNKGEIKGCLASDSVQGYQTTFKTAYGSADSLAALTNGDAVMNIRGFGYNGLDYDHLACIRIKKYGDTGGAVGFGLNLRSYAGFTYDRILITDRGDIIPDGADDFSDIGSASKRFANLYVASGVIDTSDERLKDNIADIPNEVLDAWEEVQWCQYQFKNALAKKGENARIHTGTVAQRIKSVFEAHNLDAFRYGLLCYDEWDATEEIKDENGDIITPAQEAGNRYSLRYEEALCMEAAYQRRRANRLEARVDALEEILRVK